VQSSAELQDELLLPSQNYYGLDVQRAAAVEKTRQVYIILI
jgi:hypothetical protein